MKPRVAIVGAGVSGLTCGVLLVEQGFPTSIFAQATGQQTTSAMAAAIWFPYDAEPAGRVLPWALETYRTFLKLCRDPASGVSMIELRHFMRHSEIQIPPWARDLGARKLTSSSIFAGGYALSVPLMDTTLYLDYLADRFRGAGGKIHANVYVENLEEIDRDFSTVINCSGLGACSLARDPLLEPHRGQVALVPRINDLSYAIACDDAPLTYAIPRRDDCVFGGTNEVGDDLAVDTQSSARILAECSRALGIAPPRLLAVRVGLRPFRKSGVRLERARLDDGRTVIHNYGHGGAGFTLSWGCAREVLDLAL